MIRVRLRPIFQELPALAVIAACASWAWVHRFVQDDAFISFRYAQNLAEGRGLVFNAGEYVEGYTNFFWTIIIASAVAGGIDPVAASIGIGMMLFIGTLSLTYLVGFRLFGVRWQALLATFLVGSNFTFSAYATGGLETQLQTFLGVTCFALCLDIFRSNQISPSRLAVLSLAFALSVLTRLDMLIIAGVFSAVVLLEFLNRGVMNWRNMWLLAGPFLAVVGAWFCWKYIYYGDIFPNSFYAKVVDQICTDSFPLGLPIWMERWLDNFQGGLVKHGLFFLKTFVESYRLWAILLVALLLTVFLLVRGVLTRSPEGSTLVLVICLWCTYVAKVGGDFMEFRFLVPIIPFGCLYLFWIGSQLRASLNIALALFVSISLFWGSVWHMTTFEGAATGIESIRSLASHPRDLRWQALGETLAHYFANTNVSVALLPLGVASYKSRLPTIDMLGVTDRYIAHETRADPVARFGHQRTPPVSYLKSRRVVLVIGEPWFSDCAQLDAIPHDYQEIVRFLYHGINKDIAKPENLRIEFPNGFSLLAFPMSDAQDCLVTLYLTEHPVVEALISQRQDWRRLPIDPSSYDLMK
jgi:arabinofuranosyltransferase